MMLTKDLITTKKNLLAFSGGIDSSALFFLLIENNIEFDIIIVNYNQREQCQEEVHYANCLAKKYNKICYLKNYDELKFTEKLARDFRYAFFDEIVAKYNYESLITGHQLNDKLEWFLMPLSKGAGVNELIGLVAQSNRLNYTLYRPILDISKDELKEYLYKHDIKYFVDESNMNTKFKRNYFRKEFSNKFITEYKEGVKRSFDYIQEDIKSLNLLESTLVHENLSIAKFFKADMNVILRYIDKKLKQFGIIISSASRDEIKKQKSIIISNRICIEVKDNIVWISPLIITIMEKSFKDECRILRVPSNIRPYLFNIDKKEFDCLSIKIKKFIT